MDCKGFIAFTLLVITANVVADNPCQPNQLHIAYGDDLSKMIISWSTVNDTDSIVKYGLTVDSLTLIQKGNESMFVDGGNEKRTQYIHRVDLVDLKPNTTYFYMAGGPSGWSATYHFKTMPEGEDWSPSLAVFGDLGSENAQSLPRLKSDSAMGMYDAILHVGDFAYDLASNNGRTGDEFMEQIEPIASSIPYMTCVGNHENAYNFSNYRYIFNMPTDNKKMYYSFNMGPVHFISISTEFFYFPYYGVQQLYDQYDWVKQDLIEANKPENRLKRPWIITFGHRPMYCSNNDNDDCTNHESLVRVGIPSLKVKGFEDLFHDMGVDVAIWAHEHSYERLWPLYNMKVMNGSYDHPYTNPGGITHIITGSAGCSERLEYFMKDPPEWSAVRVSDYGFLRMNVFNKTHILFEQVSDDQNGRVIDSFTLIRDRHDSYNKMNRL
ncbi:acid phosphatase type 7-like [Biomphalaria glabrata]|uniref:Purple acid phosphatase n=1 Tax=Biomphalaria glabrata TaxID=6526 RepID=A0A9U8E1J3_BIOGL|nr:acid phosphatase type 7-like [Biomphalaria glabrata]